MPTHARKHQLVGSLIYHIYNRSNRRLCIFHSDRNYRYFMMLLKEYVSRFKAKLYNWGLLFNHFHLLLEIADPWTLSQMIGGLCHAYTIYYHRSYETCGYLWQGRFKLQPVQKERYLAACGRYIERNPVRAGKVKEAFLWPYSSARFYCAGISDGLTCESPLYRSFGCSAAERQNAYRQFLLEYDKEEEKMFRDIVNPVGDDEFKTRLRRFNGRYMPKTAGRPKAIINL